MHAFIKTGIVLSVALPFLNAGELPPRMQASFCMLLAKNAGSEGRVLCLNPTILSELEKLGVKHDPNSKIAWASSREEVKKFKALGKLVICPNLEWLSEGGSVAVVEEENKPAVYLHLQNINDSGTRLSDAIIKIGKKYNK